MHDMSIVAKNTSYVTGYENQTKEILNPSFYTAQGVLQGLIAAVQYRFASTELSNRKILIKGVGNVGGYLTEFLSKHGASLYLTDIHIEKAITLATKFDATVVELDQILQNQYDVICPCDTSFMVTKNNIDKIQTNIIVGATNNQLETDSLATELKNHGIIYCPDYVVNSGGLIYVTKLYEQASIKNIDQKVDKLYSTTLKVIQKSENENISTKLDADQLAEERLARA